MSLQDKLKKVSGGDKSFKDRLTGMVNKENDGFFKEAAGAAARFASRINPVTAVASAITAVGVRDKKTSDPLTENEIAGQTDLNHRMGYRTDENSNITGTMSEFEFREEFGNDVDLPQAIISGGDKGREARIVTTSDEEPAPQNEEVSEDVITKILEGEGLNSTPDQLAAAFEREGAVGPGQHRQIFFDQYNPKFKEIYGRDYDRENLEDVRKVTSIAIRGYMDRFGGSLDAALIAYNKGPSVAQSYIDDPNYDFADDPYVQGFRGR